MSSDPKNDATELEIPSTRSMPYPTSRLAPRYELVDLAREIEQADAALGTVVGAQLDVIREQMRSLKEQAERLLLEAQTSARLHRARCQFKKIPGRVYHLYRRDEGELYFSMLSPADWKGAPPHSFEGSYRLEADMSWVPVEDARERPDGRALIERLLGEGVKDPT